MRRWAAALALVAAITMAGFAIVRLVMARKEVSARLPSPSVASVSKPPAAMTVDAPGPEATRVGARMDADDGVANDVVFLIAAAVRARCQPTRAHDLPRMAVLARLPVLTAGKGQAPDALRRDVSHTVNLVVQRATCLRPMALHIGTYRRVLDVEAYARAFPDSYFDPAATKPPLEARGVDLAERVSDNCTPVTYAAVSLDGAHAWQCSGVRSNARAAILRLCHTEGASPDRAAADIQEVVRALPATCQ